MTTSLVRCFTDAELLRLIYVWLVCGGLIGFVLGWARFSK